MKATLKNYRQSPRKVRLLADLVRGKSVQQAVIALSFTSKRATGPIVKLIQSAAANAEKNHGASGQVLVVSDIRVDKGVTVKRWMPKAFGRATPINKRTSNIAVVLAEKVMRPAQKGKSQSGIKTEGGKSVKKLKTKS